MEKPRAEKLVRSLSFSCTVTPVDCTSTSARLFSPMSSMRWRVTTEIDCGVSRIDKPMRVAVAICFVV